MADKKARRGKGLAMSAGKGVKKEEVQQVDELKKSTLGSYIKRATGDAISRSHSSQFNLQRGVEARDKGDKKGAKAHFKKSEKESKKTMDRFHGINRAAGKLTPGKSKDEYLADKNPVKVGGYKTFKQKHSSNVKATNEEKMIGSEYSGYMKGVKSTNRDVRSAVSHTLDQKKSPLTKKHAKHPEVKKAQKYMTQEQMQLMTNLDMDESISALVKRGVGKVKQAMGDAGQAYRDNDAKQKKAGKGKYYNPMSGDNIAKRYPGRLELKKG